MMETRSRGLLLALLLLVAASAAALAAEGHAEQACAARAEDFQRLVGGLGFGPTLDWSECPFSFDPRLEDACGADLGPIAGGGCFCPHHACSVWPYPPLRRRQPVDPRGANHATLP